MLIHSVGSAGPICGKILGMPSHVIGATSVVLVLPGGHEGATCIVRTSQGRWQTIVGMTDDDGLLGRELRAAYPDDFPGASSLVEGQRYFVEWRSIGSRTMLLGSDTFVFPRRVTTERVPHKLTIHLDWVPGDELHVRWSYPYATPHTIPEQPLIWADDIPDAIADALKALLAEAESHIESRSVHQPHQDVQPHAVGDLLKLKIQDSAQPGVPDIRARFRLSVPGEEAPSVTEEVSMDVSDLADENEAWRPVREWAKGRAWTAYEARFTPMRS